MRYEKPKNGELVFPNMEKCTLACCDCGLVHDMKFDVYRVGRTRKNGTFTTEKIKAKRYRVGFSVVPNNRATAAMRRQKK